jgi:hypothetical protein
LKPCAYCGKENEDLAAFCAECGTTEFKLPPATAPGLPSPPPPQEQWTLRDGFTDPVQLFRVLIIASTLSYIIWFFQHYLFGRLVSQEVWDALSWSGYGSVLQLPTGIGWLWMLVSVAAAVGLCSFSKSARMVFTLLIVFDAVLTLLGGVVVNIALGSFLGLVETMADGAILVMAYTSPLKDRFV